MHPLHGVQVLLAREWLVFSFLSFPFLTIFPSLSPLPPGRTPSVHSKLLLGPPAPTSAVERALGMIAPKSSQLVGHSLHSLSPLMPLLDEDHIRPDWEAKLAAVRAAVTRRANRRIIMRQVGDRLIPVGVTSGRVHTLPTTEGAEDGENGSPGSTTGSRRRRGPRANGQTDLSQLLGQMGLGGQDLEEASPHLFSSPLILTLH